LALVTPLAVRTKRAYKAVQRGCASSVGVAIVNAGPVYLINLCLVLPVYSPRLGLLTAPVAGLEERPVEGLGQATFAVRVAPI
jgi:hypothetical protein